MLWKNLRVTVATMNLLKRYRANLETQVLEHPDRYPAHLAVEQVSLGAALHYLLDQQRAHVLRAKKARKLKALKRAMEDGTLRIYDEQEASSEPPDPQGQAGVSPSEQGG